MVAVVRCCADKGHVASDFVAMRVTNDFLVRESRTHIIDPKIESRDTPRCRERHDHGATTGRVDQAGNTTAVQHTGLRIAHEFLAVRKGEGQVLRPIVDDVKIQSLVVRDSADIAPL